MGEVGGSSSTGTTSRLKRISVAGAPLPASGCSAIITAPAPLHRKLMENRSFQQQTAQQEPFNTEHSPHPGHLCVKSLGENESLHGAVSCRTCCLTAFGKLGGDTELCGCWGHSSHSAAPYVDDTARRQGGASGDLRLETGRPTHTHTFPAFAGVSGCDHR